MLVSVSFICICASVGLLYGSSICACVPYLYRCCVSGVEHRAANTGNYDQVRGSFAGDAVSSEIVVRTSASTYRRCTE